jgi:hypothetical protein
LLVVCTFALSSCRAASNATEGSPKREAANNSAQRIFRTKVIRWDLRTVARGDAGVPDGVGYASFQNLTSGFAVEIVLLSGKVLRTTGDLVTVRTKGPTGPIEEISVKRSLLPLVEADALLDELVAEWGVDATQAQSWKLERATLGPQTVFSTSEPEMSIQVLSDSEPPTTQTVDYQIYRENGFGNVSSISLAFQP